MMMHHGVKTTGLTALAFTLGLVMGGLPARAQEGVFMKDVLGKLGIIDEDAPPIEYRERAPLVVPPSAGLPKPQDPEAIAARNPNWPKDPDVEAAKRAREDAKKPVPVKNNLGDGAVLPVDQIRAGRRPSVNEKPEYKTCHGDNCREELILSPDFLRSNGKKPEESSSLAYGKEPPRQDLTEPPKGYRMPSANAPLGNGKAEPITRDDPADPRKFIREQAGQQ